MITINGLSGDYYYVNNPIYLELFSDDNSLVRVMIEGQEIAEINTIGGSYSYLEIGNYIKSFLGVPNYDEVDKGMDKLQIVVLAYDPENTKLPYRRQTFNKYFLRGGYFTG